MAHGAVPILLTHLELFQKISGYFGGPNDPEVRGAHDHSKAGK